MMMVGTGLGRGAPLAGERDTDSTLRRVIRGGSRIVHSVAACPSCWLASTLLFALAGVDLSGYDVPLLAEGCALLALLPIALSIFDGAPRCRAHSRTGIQRKRCPRSEAVAILPYAKLAPFLTETIFDRWRR